ncbi:TPA: hypothetical protein SIA28_000155 [Aeromonas salmonicida]|nr:hypothetical protein [Aeromonas salmonicida]HEH9420431.1 hypothetical protein [Aeromonas salmonicida]HEH9433680.1 hypothetical protein [Aeromonas salmonicida]
MSSSIKDIYSDYYNKSRRFVASNRMGDSAQAVRESLSMDARDDGLYKSVAGVEKRDVSVDNDFDIQRKLRRGFGKKGVNKNKIGGHPDFDLLASTGDTQRGYVTTLFIDIKNSTKLGVIYEPEMVFSIKNGIIKCAIETILAFDGHVHRIMGDAVLAFFRSGERPENSAINAINCAVCLVKFIEDVVSPELKQQDIDPVGIRIGIDYGDDDSVLWGMYGYHGASEVTATSFHVDVAAKLQQAASKNKIMIGDSLKRLIDIPSHYLNVRSDSDRYVKPNYTDERGKQICYKQFELKNEDYFKMLPLDNSSGLNMLPFLDNDFYVEMSITDSKGSPSQEKYFPCGSFVYKKRYVKFKVSFTDANFANYKVRYRVENNGLDARLAEPENNGNHETFVDAVYQGSGSYLAVQIEPTAYLGLHYMYVSVYKNDSLYMKEKKIGVYVA